MLYSISGRQKVLGFYNYLCTVTSAHMWLLNNLSSFVKNVIIVKHNTSAIGKTCPSVVLYCFLKYLRECQFFKEIVIFQKSDPFFVLFQTAITLLILTLHWKAMLFWKCLYPYFNFKWLFDVATEVKILLWHSYHMSYFWSGYKIDEVHNIYRDHLVYVPSQWEMTLHCNVILYWLGAYTKWSLHIQIFCHIKTSLMSSTTCYEDLVSQIHAMLWVDIKWINANKM